VERTRSIDQQWTVLLTVIDRPFLEEQQWSSHMIFEVFFQRHRQEKSQSSNGVQLKFLGLREDPFNGIARSTLSWQLFDVRQKSE
jgi:hypothetical protein